MGDAAEDGERRALEEHESPGLSECSSCKAPIRWERTVRDKPIPLDPEPVDDAHLFIRGDGRVADDRSAPAPDDALRYITHFVTCPNAAEHRRSQ